MWLTNPINKKKIDFFKYPNYKFLGAEPDLITLKAKLVTFKNSLRA